MWVIMEYALEHAIVIEFVSKLGTAILSNSKLFFL